MHSSFAVSLNAQLSLVFVVAVPFLVVSLALIISTAFPRFRLLQQATDGINRILQENFIGIRVVKSFVREPFERVKFGVENTNFKTRALHAMYVIVWKQPYYAINRLCLYDCSYVVWWKFCNAWRNDDWRIN